MTVRTLLEQASATLNGMQTYKNATRADAEEKLAKAVSMLADGSGIDDEVPEEKVAAGEFANDTIKEEDAGSKKGKAKKEVDK